MAGLMVIFDFDKTIIECDSDNWVIDNLGFTDIFNHLLPAMPWNSLMDHMMGEIHSNGISMEDIEQVLQHVPIHPRTVLAVKTAHALGCDLRIVSDANIFFINTILEHLGIKDCFSEINTNPSYVDEEGRLRIGGHNDFRNSSHGCQLCPPNMCKGTVIERIQASLVQEGVNKKRIIYLGDGAGDYCPSLKLNHGDFVMPRKNFPVWELINRNPNLIRAQIHEWTDGEELEQVLLHIIDKVISEEDNIPDGSRNQMVVDCKLQTISMVSQEALGPAALPVPQ